MEERCVNCGINTHSVDYSALKSLPNDLINKLRVWLKHTVDLSANNAYICEPCIKNVRLRKKRGKLRRNICLGCGTTALKESFVLTGDQLQECRSWVSKRIAVDHLDKICHSCYKKLTNSGRYKLGTTIKNVFVGIVVDEQQNGEIKTEPESVEDNVKCPLKEEPDDDMSEDGIENDDNHDSNISDDQNPQEDSNISDDDLNTQVDSNISNDDQNTQDNSDNESDSELVKSESECTDNEYIEELPASATNSKPRYKIRRKQEDDDDEEYIPRSKTSIPEPSRTNQTDSDEETIMIKLENYKRTTRIGQCIFSGCIEDCISLIPNTVRRKMLIEHNTYIPLLSKVCEEHLQDQNWEEICGTTNYFRADHCQDLKNIATEAAQANLDFENINTVDAKLVRYWFDLNKGEFNRIFNLFPTLKRLKKGKTAFAVYLMHLQKTSIKRIALLLKMKERGVMRRITFVQDLVKCNSFKMFKDRFLEDD